MKFSWCPDLVPFECWSQKRLVEKSNTCIRSRLEVPKWLAVWIWFLSSCEPRKPNFEKNEMRIWQTNHPNHAKSSSTYRGVRHLITFSNAWTRSEQRGTRIPPKNWLSRHRMTGSWIWFPFEVLHHKPFRKGIGCTYWMKLYDMDVWCNHGLCRGFGPVPVRSRSRTGFVGNWAYPGFYNGHPIMQNVDIDLMSQACANPHRYDLRVGYFNSLTTRIGIYF